ncbi:MAG TPA: MFS transporter [Streptosporangiaceae bacterium]|jgi:MFS family permease
MTPPGAPAAGRRTGWLAEVSPEGWRALRAGGIGWLFEVYDVFILSLTIPAFIHDFGLTSAGAGLLATAAAAAQIVGGIIGGRIADRFGRVNTLVLAVVVYAVFTGVTAIAPTLWLVVAGRVLAGTGMGAQWTAGAALVAETWPARHRGKGGALMQAGLPLGSLLAVGVAYVVTSLHGTLDDGGWRWLYAVGALPILFAIYVARTTREPAASKARADAVREHRSLRLLLGDGNAKPLLIALGFVFFVQYVYWAVFTFAPTFLKEVKGASDLSGLSFVLTQQVGSLIGFVVFALVVDRWGRRRTFALYLVVGAVAVAFFVTTSSNGVLLVANFFTGLGITGLFAGLGPWSAEMMHRSPVRGFAMGIIYNGGRVGGAIAPYVVGALASSVRGFQIGMATAVVAFVCAFVVIAISTETKGRVLRE